MNSVKNSLFLSFSILLFSAGCVGESYSNYPKIQSHSLFMDKGLYQVISLNSFILEGIKLKPTHDYLDIDFDDKSKNKYYPQFKISDLNGNFLGNAIILDSSIKVANNLSGIQVKRVFYQKDKLAIFLIEGCYEQAEKSPQKPLSAENPVEKL